MRVIRGPSALPVPVAATIGNFDGVHLGHRALLLRLKKMALLHNLPTAVIVFEPQPAEYFLDNRAPARLTSLRDKIIQLDTCQVDFVICLKFDADLAQMDAHHFAESLLFKQLQIRLLLVGQDFHFGYQRQGDFDLLQAQASKAGAEVQSFPDVYDCSQRISSTRVREALIKGDFAMAVTLLGRPYTMGGRVVYGAQRGRQWGIPTANIALHPRQRALSGVYFVKLHRPNGQVLNAVANVGSRPTVDGSRAFLEVHVLNFEQSLYSERVSVEFLASHRPEIKFPSVEALIEQIRYDIQSCHDYFAMTESIDQ